jgi:hypothetical protein
MFQRLMLWIWNKKKSIRDSNVISSRQLGGACRRKRLEWEVPVEKDVLIELRHRESRQITGLLRQWTFGWAYKDNNPPTHLRAHRECPRASLSLWDNRFGKRLTGQPIRLRVLCGHNSHNSQVIASRYCVNRGNHPARSNVQTNGIKQGFIVYFKIRDEEVPV